MKFPKKIYDFDRANQLRQEDCDFIIGKDKFPSLEINSVPDNQRLYYFFYKKDKRLIKQFILDRRKKVDYMCRITLIKKGNKFMPRLAFSIRNKTKKITSNSWTTPTNVKANVDLKDCYGNFWKLIFYLQSLSNIEIPKEKFSLMSQNENEIVSALRGRETDSIVNIIKQLSASSDVSLTEKDINLLLKRREKLTEFKKALAEYSSNESWWQSFFKENEWIFGYGLDYNFLRQQQSQPTYSGAKVDGKGEQRGDYLMSTTGNLNFTILVEIKTPATPLLRGKKEIRSGAWSLSRELTDALSQIQANIQAWEKQGSKLPENQDKFKELSIFTFQPKGIIVIGSLGQLEGRNKRETFERFRKSIHGVDIIAYDELFERAKFIVEKQETKK